MADPTCPHVFGDCNGTCYACRTEAITASTVHASRSLTILRGLIAAFAALTIISAAGAYGLAQTERAYQQARV